MLYKDFLKTLTGCSFCEETKINKNIVENSSAYLTYAIAPYHKHHLLVVPRRHVEIILDLNEEEVADLEDLQKRGMQLLKKLGYSNMTIVEREGDNTAKSVPHLHTHLIPAARIGDLDHNGNEISIKTNENDSIEIIILHDPDLTHSCRVSHI